MDTASHECAVVPNTAHSHCKAQGCNEGPHVPCINNDVVSAVFLPPEGKCFNIVNFINNSGTVISMSASGLCPNAMSKFLLKNKINDESATVAKEKSNNDTISKDDEGILMMTDANKYMKLMKNSQRILQLVLATPLTL
eukprot:3879352-Ditylum_brightwellii.AAC.1